MICPPRMSDLKQFFNNMNHTFWFSEGLLSTLHPMSVQWFHLLKLVPQLLFWLLLENTHKEHSDSAKGAASGLSFLAFQIWWNGRKNARLVLPRRKWWTRGQAFHIFPTPHGSTDCWLLFFVVWMLFFLKQWPRSVEYGIQVSSSTYSCLLLFLTRAPAAEADLELMELMIDLELLILWPLPQSSGTAGVCDHTRF